MASNMLRGHLEGLLLALLESDAGHGYALSERLALLSDGELTVPEGSLYPALQRLERGGFVSSSWTTVEGRRRRVYRLTRSGRRQADAGVGEWRAFSSAVDRVLGGLA